MQVWAVPLTCDVWTSVEEQNVDVGAELHHCLHCIICQSRTASNVKLLKVECGKQNDKALFNSLAPGKFECNFRYVISKRILVIAGWGISCEIALIWMPLDFTNDQSTLVQVMAWCRQATSHYLSQCWCRSLSPYGVTRPQWVKRSIAKYAQNMQFLLIHTYFFLFHWLINLFHHCVIFSFLHYR